MWIMATATARLSSVENARAQSNVRTNGCSRLKHRTDQDENKVSWTDWSLYWRLRRMQSDNRLISPRVFSIICYPLLLLSLRYLRRSWVQLNNKIRTEQHTTVPAYDFTRTLVAQSLVRTCPSTANFKKQCERDQCAFDAHWIDSARCALQCEHAFTWKSFSFLPPSYIYILTYCCILFHLLVRIYYWDS